MSTMIDAADQLAANSSAQNLTLRIAKLCNSISANGGLDAHYTDTERKHWVTLHLALNLQFAQKHTGATAPFS